MANSANRREKHRQVFADKHLSQKQFLQPLTTQLNVPEREISH